MKNSFKIVLFFTGITLMAQSVHVASGVYPWNEQPILEGTTPALDLLKVIGVRLPAGMDTVTEKDTVETLIILKQGRLNVSLGEDSQTIGPRSIVMIMPGDVFQYQNTGTDSAAFYMMKFKSRKPANAERADSSGGSFIVDYEKLEFKPHDKGGLRNYYRRSTALFDSAEMHVTTLNPHIKSHEPHTHGAAEFVLMISGNTRMQIGDKFYQAAAGDLYYLESDIPHAIENSGDESCMYFAIQWE